MRVEFDHIAFSGKDWITPKHGEILHKHEIVILLGEVLEVRNYINN